MSIIPYKASYNMQEERKAWDKYKYLLYCGTETGRNPFVNTVCAVEHHVIRIYDGLYTPYPDINMALYGHY
jgi:hypothetical protein